MPPLTVLERGHVTQLVGLVWFSDLLRERPEGQKHSLQQNAYRASISIGHFDFEKGDLLSRAVLFMDYSEFLDYQLY